MKVTLLFNVLFICLLSTLGAHAKESLRYNLAASESWYPYYIPDEDKPGILGELIPLILDKAKIHGIELRFPPKRTIYAMDNGLLDFDVVSPVWFPGGDAGEQFVFSHKLFGIEEYYASLDGTQLGPMVYKEEVGTILGYYYFDENTFTRIDFASEKELVLALHKNRVERILIGDLPAKYWANKLSVSIRLDQLHTKGELKIRLNKSKIHLLPLLNKAITELQQTGKIDILVSKYTVNQK
ncbi:ABC transporter substrate-binding protein [Pseudoalteromonas phenolica]|uniref:ABC transporter substrate-binding protein n=1 Tax=Pseudoalteromonas phenolica TaxID=161398 RepID=A0A5R9Q5R8_9GAMM|nr:amino acid ABC transporter substrate-binding protein [Pseudoalteromonas phenolica]TLX48501.1 ABC transporter substrate-binding protein [Pseudoalteromonas phenolica]